jgi:hypothetical protein
MTGEIKKIRSGSGDEKKDFVTVAKITRSAARRVHDLLALRFLRLD